MNIRRTIVCRRCGYVFADFDAAIALDEDGVTVLACPECGDHERRITTKLSGHVSVARRDEGESPEP